MTSFYITSGNCGLKFSDAAERNSFWQRLTDAQRLGAERIGNRTIRFYPAKLMGGFEWPLTMGNGPKTNQAQETSQSVRILQHTQNAVPPTAPTQPATVTTSNPFEKMAANPTRPLPGLCPPPPTEMLAVEQPAPEITPPAQPPTSPLEPEGRATEEPAAAAEAGVSKFTNTETIQPVTLPSIDKAGESPEGPGTDGNKPLMRNQQANEAPSATGDTDGNILPDPEPPDKRTRAWKEWKARQSA